MIKDNVNAMSLVFLINSPALDVLEVLTQTPIKKYALLANNFVCNAIQLLALHAKKAMLSGKMVNVPSLTNKFKFPAIRLVFTLPKLGAVFHVLQVHSNKEIFAQFALEMDVSAVLHWISVMLVSLAFSLLMIEGAVSNAHLKLYCLMKNAIVEMI